MTTLIGRDIVNCAECIHSGVCRYKNDDMEKIKEKVNSIKSEIAPLSPLNIRVECSSFVKDNNTRILAKWNLV